jgi:hypothetical protein
MYKTTRELFYILRIIYKEFFVFIVSFLQFYSIKNAKEYMSAINRVYIFMPIHPKIIQR